MSDLKFVCGKCGCTKLEEVVDCEFALNPITRLDSKGDHDYGPPTLEGDTAVGGYQCAECGDLVTEDGGIVDDCVWLAGALKRRPENRKRKKSTKTKQRKEGVV